MKPEHPGLRTQPPEKFRFKWNTHGLMREHVYQTHATNGYIFITEYTHPKKDAHGNWIRRIAKTQMIHDGEKRNYSEETAAREIEYFTD